MCYESDVRSQLGSNGSLNMYIELQCHVKCFKVLLLLKAKMFEIYCLFMILKFN